MNNKKPVNLNITTIKLPLPAYTSILHRVAGVLLFLGFGLFLYGLELSLASDQTFAALKTMMASVPARLALWVVLSALIYHFVAGIKHLLMDIDIGDGQRSGRVAAALTLGISALLIILAGVWIW